MLSNYKEQTDLVIDIAVLEDENTQDKKLEKIDKYQILKPELEQLCKVKIMMISVVVCALGVIPGRSPGWLAQIQGTISEVELQKRDLLGMEQVLQPVLRLPGVC